MRQILELETDLTKEEIKERFKDFFEKSGFVVSSDKETGSPVFQHEDLKGPRYFRILVKEDSGSSGYDSAGSRILRIEGWVRKMKKELAVGKEGGFTNGCLEG